MLDAILALKRGSLSWIIDLLMLGAGVSPLERKSVVVVSSHTAADTGGIVDTAAVDADTAAAGLASERRVVSDALYPASSGHIDKIY